MAPDRGNPQFAARFRPGQRRRSARSLRDPGGSGPKGAAPSASFPLGGAASNDAWLLQAAGARSPGPLDLAHLQSAPAAESHGPGSSQFPHGSDQPRLPPGAPGGGASRRGLSGPGSPRPAVSAREHTLVQQCLPGSPRLGAERQAALVWGVVRSPGQPLPQRYSAPQSPGPGSTGTGKHRGSSRIPVGI
ncbi:hypothetical protein NDU88_005529 [Pleurodeles waltl]|uniref:Uncharacterized protein n=1 Tax=Pleurodeles waltl TaxID=8319 RepID=A0AAV7TUJ2_PLEWA|nr:hypothetical protein NDU88_005529 [Pleurodeles waltl]